MENEFRNQNWIGRKGNDGHIYRTWMTNQGIPTQEFDGRPIIAIWKIWSELVP